MAAAAAIDPAAAAAGTGAGAGAGTAARPPPSPAVAAPAAPALSVGLVGLLIIDRDAAFVRDVMARLDSALRVVRAQGHAVDMVVSLRPCDVNARAACDQYRPKHARRFTFVESCYTVDGTTANGGHLRTALDAICRQRNRIRRYAIAGHDVPLPEDNAPPTDSGSGDGTAASAGPGATAAPSQAAAEAKTAAANGNGHSKQHSPVSSPQYEWLFFLDSDIALEPDTLSLLLRTGQALVGAVYVPRWSAVHTAVGVLIDSSTSAAAAAAPSAAADEELMSAEADAAQALAPPRMERESPVQLLLDPHLLRPCATCCGGTDAATAVDGGPRVHRGPHYCRPPPPHSALDSKGGVAGAAAGAEAATAPAASPPPPPPPPASFECAVLGMGATLLRRDVFARYAFRVGEVIGGVEGEDIGLCIDLIGDPDNPPRRRRRRLRRHHPAPPQPAVRARASWDTGWSDDDESAAGDADAAADEFEADDESVAPIRPRFLAQHMVHHFGAAKTKQPFIPKVAITTTTATTADVAANAAGGAAASGGAAPPSEASDGAAAVVADAKQPPAAATGGATQPHAVDSGNGTALLTHIRFDQLFWVQNDLPIDWLVVRPLSQTPAATAAASAARAPPAASAATKSTGGVASPAAPGDALWFAAAPSATLPPGMRRAQALVAGDTSALAMSASEMAMAVAAASSAMPLPLLLQPLRDGCDLPVPPRRIALETLLRRAFGMTGESVAL